MTWDTLILLGVILISLTLLTDIIFPSCFQEGFTINASDNPFLSAYFPRRGDVSFNTEEAGYIQDKRHVMGYADVQGLGVNHDFCRMVKPKGADDSKKFFACALGGTENLASTKFQTLTIENGFLTSRDDYMRDASNDTKSDYCAVVKMPSGAWEPQCYKALPTSFDTRTFLDTNPPDDISEILYFYEGILFWFRFIDDMKDYGGNLTTYISGDLTIDEADVKVLPSQLLDGSVTRTTNLDERVQVTKGLVMNGTNEFLRLGDSPDMSFGKKISLTTMRAMSFWVYFEEFTNNAHILDFGNGAGIDNVFVGIMGRGDETMEKGSEIRKDASDLNDVLPDNPCGAQCPPVMSPMQLMLSTSANVECPPKDFGVLPRRFPPKKKPTSEKQEGGQTATLIYEIWNGKLRMQHMVVQRAFKLKEWTHVCITTASGDAVRPAVEIWINGEKATENPSGHLPQTSLTTNNYLGKSNWQRDSSQYENRPELFKGSLFDLRGYKQAVNKHKIEKTIRWGKLRLGLSN